MAPGEFLTNMKTDATVLELRFEPTGMIIDKEYNPKWTTRMGNTVSGS